MKSLHFQTVHRTIRAIATQLLKQVCSDAQKDGYEYVESYPTVSGQTAMAFTGPVRLYEKNGFQNS